MSGSESPLSHGSFPSSTLVPLRLVRVVLRERSDQQWIFLQEEAPEKEGAERGFPIVIGTGEASEIHRIVTGVAPPRPLTHQLSVSAIQALGSRVLGVDIVDLRSNTFYAQLRLAAPSSGDPAGPGEILVDARPSDALAIALRTGAPIRVAESVLEQVRTDKAQDVLDPSELEGGEPDPDGHPGDAQMEDPEGQGSEDGDDDTTPKFDFDDEAPQ